jgi:ATP-dependent exoDNAse (exonuclease V) alpha subunit
MFSIPENEKTVVENLIIDESSMIDLFKMALLFSSI